jgi:hypothetical protein
VIRFAAIALATVLLAASSMPSRAHGAAARHADVTVWINRARVIGVSRFDVGVTHTHYSVDSWNNPGAVRRARALLAAAAAYQNQFTYGWGTTNPEPAPGRFDWASLDERVGMMRAMHARIILTLCGAPDWMTAIGRDTSTYSLLPPTRAHFGDFAELARRIALRYSDVRYFQVWSELRGFGDWKTGRYDSVGYTDLYNRVYDAIKRVNPQDKVGGPYMILEGSGTHLGRWTEDSPILPHNMTLISYWLAHKHGADFIALKRDDKGDHDPLSYSHAEMLRFPALLESIARQIQARTRLPIWWSEHFFSGGGWSYQAVGLASMLYYELVAGSAVALTWQPQGIWGDKYGGNYQSLFSDTRQPGGGQPFPSYHVFQIFHVYFGPGTRLYHTSSSTSDVHVLTSRTHTLLINTRPSAITVSVNGRLTHMNGYGVKLLG